MKKIILILSLLAVIAVAVVLIIRPGSKGKEPRSAQQNDHDSSSDLSIKGSIPDNTKADNSVEAQMAAFKISDGYQIELYASEGLGIAKPSAMRWDEKGRLWVLSIPSYPQPLPGTTPNDELLILEDTNHDGKADRSKIFADGFNGPLGFELGHGGVYLGEKTKLLFLKDTNNDDRADTRRTELSGFGTHDYHQTINSFTWSPGGDLFFSQGLSIYSRVETAWGVKKANRAAIWRYRPQTSQLEPFLDESTASDNPWGMNFGDWGEMFIKSNDTGIYLGNPGLILNAQKALLPEIGATHIKSGAIEILRTRHLPDSMWGNFLIAGYYNNKIERFTVKDAGSGFRAELMAPLLVSTNKNFRPIDIKVGPDGAIYVLDWYNPVIGHYQASMRDPKRDKTHGRIWRITAKGRKLVTLPALSNQPVPVLLEQLKSEEYWQRYQARRLLAEKPFQEISEPLHQWAQSLKPGSRDYDRGLMEAICVYESHDTINEPLLQLLIKSRDNGARSYGAQAVGRWAEQLKDPLALLEPLINDAAPRVRLMALISSSSVKKPESIVLATKVLDHPMDKYLIYALKKTTNALSALWDPALYKQEISFQRPAHLAWAINIHPPLWFKLPQYRNLLREKIVDKNVKRVLLLGLAKAGDSVDIDYILSYAKSASDWLLLNQLSKIEKRSFSPNNEAALKNILTSSSSSDSLRVAALELVGAWQISSLSPAVDQLIDNTRLSGNLRARAISTMGSIKGAEFLPKLKTLAESSATPKALRVAAIKSISSLDVNAAVSWVIKEISSLTDNSEQFEEIIYSILIQKGGAGQLSAALDKAAIKSNEADLMLRVLKTEHIKDSVLTGILQKYARSGAQDIPDEYDLGYLKGLANEVGANGNAAAGKIIYENKLTCAACHAISDKGGKTGPNLSSVGSGLSVEDIITEVLWPNKNIKEGYGSIRIKTRQGDNYLGVRAFDSPEAITIRTSTSTSVTILKEDIVKGTWVGSVMPLGLTKSIERQELTDVIKYLSELKNH